jgi:hypothetical protein
MGRQNGQSYMGRNMLKRMHAMAAKKEAAAIASQNEADAAAARDAETNKDKVMSIKVGNAGHHW